MHKEEEPRKSGSLYMDNQENNQGNNNNNKNKKHNQQTLLIILVVSVVLFVMLSYMRTFFSSATNQKITYDELNMEQISKLAEAGDSSEDFAESDFFKKTNANINEYKNSLEQDGYFCN